MDFTTATTLTRLDDERFSAPIDPSWLQGRGAFGGLSAALLVRAMEGQLKDERRPLRAFSAQFCAPPRPGQVEVRARIVRRGFNVTFLSAEMLQRERVVAHAQGTFGRALSPLADRAQASMHGPPPTVVGPDEAPEWSAPIELPVYCQHLRYARVLGRELMTGGEVEPCLGGWTWLREPAPVDAALVVALLDSWPPALLVGVRELRPVGTVSMHCVLPGRSGEPAGTPLLVRARSPGTAEGYSEEHLELWTPDARLLGTSQQVVAVS